MQKGDYNFLSKLLHQIVLGNKVIGEASFDMETLLYQKKSPPQTDARHVFISGLARSGTTFLMRQIYRDGNYCSLTYQDMPFVLAPNFWRSLSKFSKQKKGIKERAHNDGIFIEYNSPEAFEEIFWSTFCGEQYIFSKKLIPMDADNDIIKKFQIYISLILKDQNGKFYLSKNNNNILRLGSLLKAFPNSIILIPFREPIQQAHSLMKQHDNFKKLHKEDPFSKKYMNWLVHHEFGSDHRPFVFNEQAVCEYQDDDINYWLTLWLNTYRNIIKRRPSEALLLSYEKLCAQEDKIWEKLAGKLGTSKKIIPDVPWEKKPYNISTRHISPSLQRNVTDLYNELSQISLI